MISCRQFKQKNTAGIQSARHVEANNVMTYYVIGSTIWLNHVILLSISKNVKNLLTGAGVGGVVPVPVLVHSPGFGDL